MTASDATGIGFVRRERCPSCASSDLQVVYESAFTAGAVGEFVRVYYGIDPAILSSAPYQLVECQSCTLLYQGWVGNDAFLRRIYGQWINDVNHPGHDQEYQRIMRQPLEYRDAHEVMTVAAYLRRRPEHLTVLDHGMGWAIWAQIAKSLGCDTYGTEISDARVEFARNCEIKVVPADDLPAERFDFVNTEQVMEHLAEVRTTAESLARSLRPGGILKISVPCGEGARALVAKLQQGEHPTISEFMPIQPLEHVNTFNLRTLHRLAETLGLRIVRPSLGQRYAFLRWPNTLSLKRPKNVLKELVRPFYTFSNSRNLYVWLQRSV